MSTPPISKYPDMGEVTGLRLELGRMTDKANALEAALRKEVMDVVREEIAKAQPKKMYDTKPDGTICIVAEDEEIAALKAEVARLKGLAVIREGRLAVPYDYDKLRADYASLRAYVERLEDAGWLMEKALRDTGGVYHSGIADRWNDAKEGKPSDGMIEATWVVSEQDAERIKARLEREKGGQP